MHKALLALATVGTLAASLIVEAHAVPAPRVQSLDAASTATVVRDRCGFRRHWSARLQRCVWNG
jgi:hypothetical protein